MENLNKLAITGALQFVAPGTATQVFAGLGVSFVSLQWFQRALPYANKSLRHIAYSASLVLFLFFLMALLIKADISPTGSATGDVLFFSIMVGTLTCAVVVVPVFIVARCVDPFIPPASLCGHPIKKQYW